MKSVSVLILPVKTQTICAGVGGMDPGVVAGAILRGVKAATSSTPLHSLTDIHLVLIKINVFLAFKQEAMQMFPTTVINRGDASFHNHLTAFFFCGCLEICLFFRILISLGTHCYLLTYLAVSVPQLPHVQQQQSHSSVSAEISNLPTASTSQKSTFLIFGFSREDVDGAMTKLKSLYQAQCSTQTFKKEELAGLSPEDMEDLKQLMETQGLYMQKNQSDQDGLTVSGLKDGVNQVMQMINGSLQGCLRREVRVREEEDLYTRVAWCILGQNGNWERVPKRANHSLENEIDLARGIVDAQGTMWSVGLQRMEATLQVTGQTAKLKRLVNLPGEKMTHTVV